METSIIRDVSNTIANLMDDTANGDGQAPERQGDVESPLQIGPEATQRLLLREGYAYLDVREPDAFEEGRPAGAINIAFSTDGEAHFVDAVRSRFEVNAKLVVGCNSGKRSKLAVSALVRAGFIDVVECRTGWDGTRGPFGELREPGWRRTGLPTERGLPTRS
jgi:rhodanese-related sulfurtransferase